MNPFHFFFVSHNNVNGAVMYDLLSFRGYTAPEYAIRGELTVKADTYSFGVLVLEIVSSRKNTDLSLPNEMQYLPEHVCCFLNPVLAVL